MYVEVKDQGSHTSVAKAAGGQDRDYMSTLPERGEGAGGMTGPQEEETSEGNQVMAEIDQTLKGDGGNRVMGSSSELTEGSEGYQVLRGH